jgi:hypothetical protein
MLPRAAVAQNAVAQAQQAATQAQQEASTIASNAVANSVSANIVSINNQQSSGAGLKINNNTNSTNFTLQSGITNVASLTDWSQNTTNNNLCISSTKCSN